MSILSETTITSHGFQITGEIDKFRLYQNKTFATKTKTVEGMPDIKWSLKVYVIDPVADGYFGMDLEVDSEKEINCVISRKPNYSRFEVFKGHKTLQVEIFSLDEDFDPNYSTSKGDKMPFSVNVAFSYVENGLKNIPKIRDPTKWGERLQQNSAKDFNILVGDESFAIHKVVIAAESTKFKQMFEDNFKEAQEGQVSIPNFNIQVVKAFIDYCYGRDISTVFQDESGEIQLLYFADKYDCQTLKPHLETYLTSKLSKENISLYVSTADKTSALQLRQACVHFVRNLMRSGDSLTAEEMEFFEFDFLKEVLAFKP